MNLLFKFFFFCNEFMAYYISENNKDEKVANSTEESILKGVTFENIGKNIYAYIVYCILYTQVFIFLNKFYIASIQYVTSVIDQPIY